MLDVGVFMTVEHGDVVCLLMSPDVFSFEGFFRIHRKNQDLEDRSEDDTDQLLAIEMRLIW